MDTPDVTVGIPGSTSIHVDTDIGGDMDDLCALAMLLRWPEVEITGVTTMAEDQGRRAGYVRYVLEMEGRGNVPAAAGVDVSSGKFRYHPGYPPELDNWPARVEPRPGPAEEATSLLMASIERGAVIVGIGQYSNLALLEKMHPGSLADANLVLMGGWIHGPRPGFSQWTNADDYNIQLDTASAKFVLERSNPLLVPLEATSQTALRRAFLPALAAAGRLGQLIVRQAEFCARDERNESRYGEACSRLPDAPSTSCTIPSPVPLPWAGVRA